MTRVVLFGLNLWLVLAMRVGLEPKTCVVGMLPLVFLAYGCWRRSDLVLLALFPGALGLFTAIAHSSVPPLLFASAALSLLCYLATVGLQAQAAPVATSSKRPLPEPVDPRWRRRARIFHALTLSSALFPSVLLSRAVFSFKKNPAELALGRLGAFQSLFLIALGLGLFGLLAAYFAAPMRSHLAGDREVTAAVDDLWHRSLRGRPRAAFYLAVATALVAMALLVWRHRAS
jgi:hypothetical protein